MAHGRLMTLGGLIVGGLRVDPVQAMKLPN
jgi:hypothetical protein